MMTKVNRATVSIMAEVFYFGLSTASEVLFVLPKYIHVYAVIM